MSFVLLFLADLQRQVKQLSSQWFLPALLLWLHQVRWTRNGRDLIWELLRFRIRQPPPAISNSNLRFLEVRFPFPSNWPAPQRIKRPKVVKNRKLHLRQRNSRCTLLLLLMQAVSCPLIFVLYPPFYLTTFFSSRRTSHRRNRINWGQWRCSNWTGCFRS